MTVSNDVPLCFLLEQTNNGSRFSSFFKKLIFVISLANKHCASSNANRETTFITLCAVIDFCSISASNSVLEIIK